ncbi:general secretion pathway protein D [Nitrosomonas cryotolerans]|uniref:General secretion pathway protein D n=1 Tax=Nitrosomonas cryotolerans ATCC 49181 TaxID=1131553 RepID=A0A1N6G4W4_9PROT|nr:secretin and TonB N-terminal domain-containing protein [Nitrosomonas cryotolerans]SFP52293.1 general secretion pathway protein D [Nitrosomonas cryotolerans]SIO02579.1 general secretion pathway protein D [Nitrosomonas cryotolerans ATCC 49181]
MRNESYIIAVLILTLMTGCETPLLRKVNNQAFIDGQQLIAAGDTSAGLKSLEQAMREEPDNIEIRTVFMRQREAVTGQLLFAADNARLSGDLDAAEQQYHHVLELASHNERAKAGLEALNLERHHVASMRHAEALLEKDDLEGAEAIVRSVLQENSMQSDARRLIKQINERISRMETTSLTLKTAFKKPLTMEFRETDLKSVFEIIARTAGINFVFDKDIRQDSKVSIFVRDNSIEDVLKLLLMTNQLAYKTLNNNSLLVYPNTPAKQKEYQELVVSSFHIANTDVKQMVAMVRGLVKAKDIYVNEKLNLFIMRDTLEAIRLVERLVALNDLPEPEVMLDVEVLEISRTRLLKLGPNFPDKVTFSAVPGAGAVAVPFNQIGFDGLKSFATSNQVIIDLKKELRAGDILANPRIRVKNREKAKILIGDKVPIITSNVTGTAATVSQSVSFIDVGLKLDVEPIISLNDEVSIKVALEVSTVTETIELTGGSQVPKVGTRTAETLLSLKDGETQVLAGLIRDEDKRSLAGIPGLIDLPVLGKILSGQGLERNKTEIVLLITPRIVRNIAQPTKIESEFHFGTANEAGKLPIAIGKTAAESLTMSSIGGGRNAASVFGRAAETFAPSDRSQNPFASNTPSSPVISLQTPATVGLNKEFPVRISLVGAKGSVTSELEMIYDTNMLELLDEGEKSGARSIRLGKNEASGMAAQFRFKVIATNPGVAEITVQSALAEDQESGESIEVTLPPAASVKIQ